MNKLLITTLLIVCAFISTAQAEVSVEKRKEIDRMFRLTGMEKLVNQMKGQLTAVFRKKSAGVSQEFWDKFEKKMDMRQLMERIVPVYDKYYTLEDLKAVNDFYETPAGQKILATLPQVMQESMKIGQEWGEAIGKQAIAEAEAEAQQK